MNKNYLLILALALTSGLFGQTFNNTSDHLWSNTGNWNSGSVPNANTAVVVLNTGDPDVDADYTVKNLTDGFGAHGVTVSGAGTLTIDGNASGLVSGIINATGNSGGDLTFSGNVTIANSSGGAAKIQNNNSASNNIYFTTTSVLNLTTKLQTSLGAGGTINFDGTLTGGSGSVSMIVGSSNVVFGTTSDNSAFGGSIVMYAASKIIVNTADDGTFLPSGQKVQVNGLGATIELNGANVYKGNVSISAANTLTLEVNKNQNNLNGIVLSSGTLTLDIDAGVTSVEFVNNSAYAWNTGTVSIVGFTPGVIRFGNDNTGLTAGQLAAISGDGVASGQELGLDSNGYLVLASTLSLEEYNHEIYTRLSYPSTTEGVLNFKVPVEAYVIYNMIGEKVQVEKGGEERQSIDVSNLKQGIYILSIEGKRVERFIKK